MTQETVEAKYDKRPEVNSKENNAEAKHVFFEVKDDYVFDTAVATLQFSPSWS